MENKPKFDKETKTLLAINKMLGKDSLCLVSDIHEIKCPQGLCGVCPYYNGKKRIDE
jgi:hypothetical protein